MAVTFRNVDKNYRLPGVFVSSVAFLRDARNGDNAIEGDEYYDTTLNQKRTYDGSNWSPAGMSGISPGSLNDAASIGGTITVDGSTVSADFAVTVDNNGNDVCATFTQNDTSNNPKGVVLVNTGSNVTLDITSSGTYDIKGTSGDWDIKASGAAHFISVAVGDDEDIELGDASGGDVRILFHEGVIGTVGSGLLFEAVGEDENLQFGDATYTFDVRFIGNGNVANNMIWELDGGTDSVGALVFNNADLVLGDNDELIFGDETGGDWVIDWDNTSLSFIPKVNNSPILMGSASKGVNLSIYGDTATSILEWNAANDKLVYKSAASSDDVAVMLDDYCQLTFGTGSSFGTTGSGDVQMAFNGTKFYISAISDDLVFSIGDSTNAFDLTWYAGTGGDTVTFDASTSRVEFVDVDVAFDDDAILYFGTGRDASLQWDNSNSTLDIGGNVDITGTLTVSGAFDIGNFAFGDNEELRFGSSNDFIFNYDTGTSNLMLDAASANGTFDIGAGTATDVIFHAASAGKDVHWDSSEQTFCLLDDTVLAFGGTAASPDVEIMWDQSKLKITGDGLAVNFGINDEGMDVLFYGATGSAQMLWDESADRLVIGDSGASVDLQDDVELLFGTGSSNAGIFKMVSDGSDLTIGEISATGKNFLLGESGKGLAVRFYGDGAGQDLLWVQGSNMLEFQDDTTLAFGDASDITIVWDQTNLIIEPASQGTGIIKVGSTYGIDFNFYGDSPSSFASFDSGAAELLLDGYDIGLQDDDVINFGDVNDITMQWASGASNFLIDGANADVSIDIGLTNNLDVIIYGNSTSDTVKFDTSEEDMELNGFDLTLLDDDLIKFGDADDITMEWDGTGSNFLIDGAAADVSIDIGLTNNLDVIIYGNSTNDTVTFDTSAEDVILDGFDLTINDDDILEFGNSGTSDCYITWDQTRLQIVPSSYVYIGDKTNMTTISSAGNLAQTGTAKIVCNSGASNMGGLQIPYHESNAPTGAGGVGSIMYEVDASRIWINSDGSNWKYVVLT